MDAGRRTAAQVLERRDRDVVSSLPQLDADTVNERQSARPTHKLGHTLDLVITTVDSDVSNVRDGDMVSDHALVHFTLRSHKSADKV